MKSALIRIRYSRDLDSADGDISSEGRVCGAGVLINNHHILTCAHVVCDSLNLSRDTEECPDGPIVLDLPLLPSSPVRTATVIADTWKTGGLDVTLLHIDKPITGLKPPPLHRGNLYKHAFSAYGCPQGQDEGVWTEGTIKHQRSRDIQLQLDPTRGYPIVSGFSGTPVWDRDARAVVGIVSEYERNQETGVAFMLSLERIAKHVDELEAVATTGEEKLFAKYRSKLRRQISHVSLFAANETYPLRDVFFDLEITDHEHPSRRAPEEWKSLLDPELRRLRGEKNSLVQWLEMASDTERGTPSPTHRTPEDLMEPGTQAVVVGAPGCGKSTLLKYLALNALRESNRLPVVLELRTLSKEDVNSADDLCSLLFQQGITDRFRSLQPDEEDTLRDQFFRHVEEGTLDVYLDGLDEVSGQAFFDDLYEMIEELARNERETDTSLVVTMRPYALRNPIPEIDTMEIQPLTNKQVNDFIDTYHSGEKMDRLLEAIHSGDLGDVVRVPLLLSLVTHLYQRDKEIVSNPLHLYDRSINYLVGRLDREKGAERFRVTDPEARAKRKAFTDLAYRRIFDNTENAARRFIVTRHDLRSVAERHTPEGAKTTDFQADLLNTPLLRPVGFNEYAFVHLVIQEYLAAKRLAALDDATQQIAASIFDPVQSDLEVVPMAISLLDSPNDVFKITSSLPESFLYNRIILLLRSQFYLQNPSSDLLDRLSDLVIKVWLATLKRESVDLTPAVRTLEVTTQDLHERVFGKFDFFNTIIGYSDSIGGIPTAALTAVGDAHTVNYLVEALSESHNNREQIVKTLGEIGSDQAVDKICEMLQDPNEDTRIAAATALGSIGDKSAVGALCDALKRDDEASVHGAVAQALGNIGDKRAVDPLCTFLIDVLDSRSPRNEANKRIRPNIENSAARAAEALGIIGDEEAAPTLRNVLPRSAKVRRSAAEALGKIGDQKSSEHYRNILRTGSHAQRAQAAEILGGVGERRDVDLLCSALRDEYPSVRREAAQALGRLGISGSIAPLCSALQDDDFRVRRCASEALSEIGDAQQAIAPLCNALQDTHYTVRESTARTLGNIGSPKSVDCLSRALKDNSVRVRIRAAEALGRIGDRKAINALNSALEDKSHRTRLNAAISLLTLESSHSMPDILNIFEYGPYNEHIKGDDNLTHAFSSLRFSTLADGLRLTIDNQDVSPAARARAVRYVGFYHDDEDLQETLRDIATNDSSEKVRQQAEEVIEKYQNKLNLFASLDDVM